LGISGIFCPFTGEPNVNTTLPEPDVPFAACHELAHAHGFAREDEANYVGYVACIRHPDPDFRYSGLLAASLYAMNALARVGRGAAPPAAGAAVWGRRIGGPRPAASKPAPSRRSVSRGSQPPAGPTRISAAEGGEARAASVGVPAFSTKTMRSPAKGRPSSSLRVEVPAIRGTTARPHCSAAPLATLSQRSCREPSRAGRAAASVRTVTTGHTSATPSSVAFWMTSSIRSPFSGERA